MLIRFTQKRCVRLYCVGCNAVDLIILCAEQFKCCQHIERVCNKARLGFELERQLVFVKVVFVPHHNGIFAYCFQRYHAVLYARHTVKRISESFSWMVCDCKCRKITVNKVENVIVGIDCFSVLYFAAIA